MAKTREQFMVTIVCAEDLVFNEQNQLVFDLGKLQVGGFRSKRVTVSENRMFRMFCKTTEVVEKVKRDEYGNVEYDADQNVVKFDDEIRSAKEFIVLDFKKCEDTVVISTALRNGVHLYDGKKLSKPFKRVVRSAAQGRTKKMVATILDPKKVRRAIGFGAKWGEKEIISKMEARMGQPLSSTIEIKEEHFTFDVLPDYEIIRKHDVEMYDHKQKKLFPVADFQKKYNPLDGQGTLLPSAAVKTAHRLYIISRQEREFLLNYLEVDEDPRAWIEIPEFAKVWAKIPSAFQIRFGFAKGLLVVYPHNKETMDCFGNDHRASGKVMKFWGGKKHEYNFEADILFTDSMWKANFSKREYDKGNVKLEIVLWQKSKASGMTFMGYQYWQALKDINIRTYAKRAIDMIKDTILTDANEALLFLGMMDSGEDQEAFEAKMSRQGGRIQKIIEILHENPEMINELYIQRSIRDLREKFIKQMAMGRIPVAGANPYIISDPGCMFGHDPILESGENYYNGQVDTWAGFRSPLIHCSEALRLDTVENDEWTGLFKDLLILNVHDDTLPRAGGADTDGDKLSITNDEGIVNAVQSDLPMLYDEGFDADPVEVNDMNIEKFDFDTIMSDAPTIGEITNMSTTWKDIMQNPAMMKRMGLTTKRVDALVKILRFMQGWAIDYAKTGFFPEFPKQVVTAKSPDWNPWSKGAVAAGIKGAEIFKSESQLGMLARAIYEYLPKFKKVDRKLTRDFTFEMTDAAKKMDIKRITPQIELIESCYRDELARVGNMDLSQEERKEMFNHLFNKYQKAMLSIDADIQTIAAVAYMVTYKNASNDKSISFPWVTCYEGILMNVSASNDNKFRLRKAYFDAHIDDVPEELEFVDGIAQGEDYRVKAKVEDGTYTTFRKNGSLFIQVESESISRVSQEIERPTEKNVVFNILGFENNKTTAAEVIELLKANDNKIIVKRVRDRGEQAELRAGVFIGDKRVASVYRKHKDVVDAYLPCEFTVANADTFKPTYKAVKSGEMKPTSAFTLHAIFSQAIELEEGEEEVKSNKGSNFVDADEDYEMPTQMSDDTEIEVDWDEEDDEEQETASRFDQSVLDQMTLTAPYWEGGIVDPSALNIVAINVKKTGAIKIDQRCAEVTLVLANENRYTFHIMAVKGARFAIDSDRKVKADFEKLILQAAHYELFVEAKGLKQA